MKRPSSKVAWYTRKLERSTESANQSLTTPLLWNEWKYRMRHNPFSASTNSSYVINNIWRGIWVKITSFWWCYYEPMSHGIPFWILVFGAKQSKYFSLEYHLSIIIAHKLHNFQVTPELYAFSSLDKSHFSLGSTSFYY